jgi:hypothetical protein
MMNGDNNKMMIISRDAERCGGKQTQVSVPVVAVVLLWPMHHQKDRGIFFFKSARRLLCCVAGCLLLLLGRDGARTYMLYT